MMPTIPTITPFRRHVALPLAAFAFGLLALSGCKQPPYPQCKKDKHCKVDLGEKCVDGMCQNCVADGDCVGKGPNGENWVCHELRCTDPALVPAGGGQGGLGSPCTQTAECTGGLVCAQGQCNYCTEDGQCEGGTCDLSSGLCSTAGGTGGQCQTDDQCAMDEICVEGTCQSSAITPGNNPCGIDAIYFDFDSPKIKPDAAEQLRSLAECMKQHNQLVYLEAHADPRGTEEYNIMLTDKRGQSVKKFLEDLGVQGENLNVVSKGNLEASGTDEAGWAKDRRVEFIFQ
jgi:peptidoglycan-associated lipoprotein